MQSSGENPQKEQPSNLYGVLRRKRTVIQMDFSGLVSYQKTCEILSKREKIITYSR
mgnify:CR=1 FL=1